MSTIELAPGFLRDSPSNPEHISDVQNTDASNPQTFTAVMFDQDEVSQGKLALAFDIVEDGLDKLLDGGDAPTVESMLEDAQRSVKDLSPFAQVAVGSFVIGSMTRIELWSQMGSIEADTPPIGLAVVRHHLELLAPTFMDARRDSYTAGKEAVNVRTYAATLETAVPDGAHVKAARLSRLARQDLGMLAATVDTGWREDMVGKFTALQNLSKSIQLHPRPAETDRQSNAHAGFAIIEDIPLPFVSKTM